MYQSEIGRSGDATAPPAIGGEIVFRELCGFACRAWSMPSATIQLRDDVCRAAGLTPIVGGNDHRPDGGGYQVVARQIQDSRYSQVRDGREPTLVHEMAIVLPTDEVVGLIRLVGLLSRPADIRQFESLATIAAAHLLSLIAARQAADQASLYRLMTENSTDTLVRGDLEGVRRYVSPSVRRMLGYEPHELIGRQAAEIVHPDDAEALKVLLSDLREGRIDEAVSEQRQRHKDGSWVWMEALIKRTFDRETSLPDGYVVSVRDISKRKVAETHLEHRASHDMLTDLPNRSVVYTWLRRKLAAGEGASLPFAVLYLDLDDFKPVNDTLGHETGDRVLQTMADRFRAVLRKEDLVARFGGDEFVVITGRITRPAAIALANRLIATAASPIAMAGVDIAVSVSIGIVMALTSGKDADVLINDADRSLYRAKKAGRNGFHIVDA